MAKLKTERQHWWPETVSRRWKDQSGCVTQIRSDGNSTTLAPEKFGHTSNIHDIRLDDDGPWNERFEKIFSLADDNLNCVADWLESPGFRHQLSDIKTTSRFIPLKIDELVKNHLTAMMASLIVRSPRSRYQTEASLRNYIEEFQVPEPTLWKSLVASNIRHQFDSFFKTMESGKYIIAIASEKEFIFGDGFLHNFPITDQIITSVKSVIPLLPTVTAIHFQPSGNYFQQPESVAIMLGSDEVDEFNFIVQVYSCSQIFYRNFIPTIHPAFTAGEFQEFLHHKYDFLESLFFDVTRFRIDSNQR